MMADILRIVILDDGTIRTESDRVSGVNHQSAENFLRGVTALSGGEAARVSKGTAHGHGHVHGHDHVHDHGAE
jgi:hypothetical protein